MIRSNVESILSQLETFIFLPPLVLIGFNWFQLVWKAPNVGGVEIAGFDLKSAKPSDSSNVVLIDCLYCVCLELSQLILPLFVQIEWLCEEMLPNRRYED